MFDLDKLYAGHKTHGDNPLCEGCSILEKSKPCHSVMDYEDFGEAPVLFLSDSLNYRLGTISPFSKAEVSLIDECYKESYRLAASVKCPSVKEADMTPDNMKLCRVHLEATIDKVKPKLVFPCGNLAMKMLIKKSGITSKRGKSYEYITTGGHRCIVVPIFHPYSCIKEPRHTVLFRTDIQNAYEKYVLGKRDKGNFTYKVLTQIEEVTALAKKLQHSEETIAIDIETTGLNFLKDKIQTIAISSKEQTWVIPCDHKDSPFKDLDHHDRFWMNIRGILINPKNKKVFHNAKFDLKFLLRYQIKTVNVWDTKIMHHLLDENMPKSLMDLTKLYFANELEDL